jgi:TolB-like protein/Flp pilus assembly protein TadD
MASLIPGYEYDIFISYRQKDNKYDGWVTEFVDNLRKELEAAFKEEISVYFDINPHDGLLETHDVDASLKDKLKCLVFIPIISRTYCDPKSFAWEHEFKAFADQASQDQFGLKIKLPNGNVANRVLPIRIHDLDINDIKECESVLGGVIRGVEFIYKEPGINRSLTPKDSEEKNLNKTNYRNQINKIALAIREIITSIVKHEQKPEEGTKKIIEPLYIPRKRNKTVIIAGSVILLALIILGFLLIPKLLTKEEPEKSIVVLPFKNHTGNPDQDYLVQGQNDALVSELCMISQVKPLRVLSGKTASAIASTSKSIPEIANEINVDYIIEGSVLNASDSINLQLTLIQAYPDERLVWTQVYKSDLSNIIKLHHNIANEIVNKIGIDLTPENLVTLTSPQKINPEAYKLYLRGMYNLKLETPESIKKGIDYLNEAISLDPADAFAHAALASGYFAIAHGPMDPGDAVIKGVAAASQAIKLDTTLAETYFALAQAYEYSLWKFPEAEKYYKKALSINPNHADAHFHYAWALILSGRNEEALSEHLLAKKYDPFAPEITAQLGLFYLHIGKNEKALQEAFKSLEIRPDYNQGLWVLGNAYLAMGKVDEAIAAHKKLAEKYPRWMFALGVTYAKAGKRSEAEEVLKRMDTLTPGPIIALGYVMLNSALNHKDEAFKWLAYEPRHIWLPWVAVMDWGSNLHGDPRFDEFVKKLNLPKK